MQIVHDDDGFDRWLDILAAEKLRGATDLRIDAKRPLLLDQYLTDAIEVDVDAIADGEDVHVAGIMQHIEEAGIHSGDSACSLPPFSLDAATIAELKRQTRLLAGGLGVIGLMNVQFAIQNGNIFILEVNPRASRTVPFVAKATGVPIAKIAALVMAGKKLADFDLEDRPLGHIAVKSPVFPFVRFAGVDIILGPEMKSTGEVMGIDSSFHRAFGKSQLAAGVKLPPGGTAFLSVRDVDKAALAPLAAQLISLGFRLLATRGTAKYLEGKGILVEPVNKVLEGRPHCVDSMISGGVDLVVNTTKGTQAVSDSFSIRRTALVRNIPHYTTMAGARAAVGAIEALETGAFDVAPLQGYHGARRLWRR